MLANAALMAQTGASHSFVMCVLNTALAGVEAAWSFLWLDTSVVCNASMAQRSA